MIVQPILRAFNRDGNELYCETLPPILVDQIPQQLRRFHWEAEARRNEDVVRITVDLALSP